MLRIAGAIQVLEEEIEQQNGQSTPANEDVEVNQQ